MIRETTWKEITSTPRTDALCCGVHIGDNLGGTWWEDESAPGVKDSRLFFGALARASTLKPGTKAALTAYPPAPPPHATNTTTLQTTSIKHDQVHRLRSSDEYKVNG